jgi:hypothetical protein
LIWSRGYKSKVLAQPASANGELKHIEWNGSGWAGQNTIFQIALSLQSRRQARR